MKVYYVSNARFAMSMLWHVKNFMTLVKISWSVTVLEWGGKVRKENTTCRWTIFPNFRFHKSCERWTWRSTWSWSKFRAKISPHLIPNTSYKNAASCFNIIFISKRTNSCYSLCAIYSGSLLIMIPNFMRCTFCESLFNIFIGCSRESQWRVLTRYSVDVSSVGEYAL